MWLLLLAAFAVFAKAQCAGAGAARLVCYSDSLKTDYTECTHLVYTGDVRGEKLDVLLKEYRKGNARTKVLLRVADDDQDLRSLVKSRHIQGLEIFNAHRSLNRTKVQQTLESARAAITSAGGGPLYLSLPAHPELLAKYYDLRALVKVADLMVVETHDLGAVEKTTYHPSRLSGMWDMMNTDSVVDLVIGLGLPASKVIISLPATAQQFTLTNETLSTPGSPAEGQSKVIDQGELCRQLQKGRWTLERDQDLSAPYAFKNKTWISFEDASSIDVKGKYARVRGLAGLALMRVDKDVETPCGPTLRTSLAKVLNQQSRAPRAAVLRSLEHEILSAPIHGRALDALQVSPYRITQVVDSDGVIHSIREDIRTEFSCSRQGYFVHPRTCARFYRCVKFDQLSPDYTVFEFDCPAGLAFDSRYEVCVWPGSLPDTQACPGSSEIAPVPRTRFICPDHEGYYADPENCRWFFACLDHGKAPLTAYEFRCPFGLGFDADRLKCDWPWLVPACGNIARYEAGVFGYSGAAIAGASGYQGQTADAINIAAHNSLVSGASANNLVGIQGGFLSSVDALDTNFITSQELGNHGNGLAHQGVGLVQPSNYNDEEKYTSGSLILDEYRQPTKSKIQTGIVGTQYANGHNNLYHSSDAGDVSGAYVHDPTGDHAEPYRHVDSPGVPYVHDKHPYSDYQDYNQYSDSITYVDGGKYSQDNSGAYYGDAYKSDYSDTGFKADYSGSYKSDNTGSYKNDYSGSYAGDNGKYIAGVYQGNGNSGLYVANANGAQTAYSNVNHGSYSSGNDAYLTDSKVYTGASHTLAAGAVNVGLVGKTTLVDTAYAGQDYEHNAYNYNNAETHAHDGHIYNVHQKSVSINHVGTDSHNLDGYSVVTTPTTSGIPTTATPFAVTTALPVVTTTYKTTLVPEPPKTSIKQIFGYSQPEVTYVHPTFVPQYLTDQVEVTDYNQAVNQQDNKNNAESVNYDVKSDGYDYPKPSVKFEDGISYTTPKPIEVSTDQPRGFSYETGHKIDSGYQYNVPVEVVEEPFKKVVAYTTGPSYVTEKPTHSYEQNAYSHQTIHNVNVGVSYNQQAEEASGYEYNKPQINYEPETVVEYTTAQPAISIQPVVSSTHRPQVFSQQTFHQVDNSKVKTYDVNSGYEYKQPEVRFEEPVVTSTYRPQVYSQQTFHNVDHSSANTYDANFGSHYNQHEVRYDQPKTVVEYTTAQPAVAVQPIVTSTYRPQVYSQQTIHKVDESHLKTYDVGTGYEYNPPEVRYEQPKTEIRYTTAKAVVTDQPVITSTYKPEVYSQQTLHKVEANRVNAYDTSNTGYEYTKPDVQYVEALQPTYEPKTYSHQTIHQVNSYVSTPAPQAEIAYQPSVTKFEANRVNAYDTSNTGYEYTKPTVQYVEALQQTYEPKTYSHQTVHQVNSYVSTPAPQAEIAYQPSVTKFEFNRVNAYDTSNTGYEYTKPAVQYDEASQPTYEPKTYSQQTIHQVNSYVSTPAPQAEIAYQPSVTVYENPILKYTQKTTPVTYVKPTAQVYTQTYQPIIQQEVKVSQPVEYKTNHQSYSNQNVILNQGYSYGQPEIQRNIESFNSGQSYSHASEVSHQVLHQSSGNQYEENKNVYVSTTAAPIAYEDHYVEYEAPKKVAYKAPEYVPPKVVYQETYESSTSLPIAQQEYIQTQDQYDYKGVNYAEQYDIVQKSVPAQKVSFSTNHVQSKPIESYHISSFPGTSVTTTYAPVSYQSPEIQVGYQAEEYLPPASTPKPVTTPYTPATYSTTSSEYLPPSSTPEAYLPPSTTSRPYVKINYKNPQYLPPKVETTYLPSTTSKPIVDYHYEYVPPKVQSTYLPPTTTEKIDYEAPEYLPPKKNTYLPPSSTTVRPGSSTVSTTTYKYEEPSTEYKAPEYLPPQDNAEQKVVNFESFGLRNNEYSSRIKYNPYQEHEDVSSTIAPIKRKQNIVVQTAKGNLLGFGTVGPDAGLISESYTPVYSSTPVSSTALPKEVISSTYAPVQQGIVDVNPRPIPARRVKPKVAVVTKINDFNPLLVRKLGAVCSCQSPIVVLRGRRPNADAEYDDYSDDYVESGRGDIGSYEHRKSQRLQEARAKFATATGSGALLSTTTFNPIIVPDDSFYQDYEEPEIKIVTPKVSTTPVYSTTEKVVRIRPRVKAVTFAPTYKTVLLNEVSSTPVTIAKDGYESRPSAIDAQSFDRYGPGGWRSRDETLQGSIDCQRAGLFRHPKQCNKFYACRWDCTKQRFTLHVFNCPVQLSFDPNIGACNWPSQGPACQGDTLISNSV